MKLCIYPAVEGDRLAKIQEAAGDMAVVNAADEEAAIREIADADAFFGKLKPPMLAAATKLRWVQSPTASLEHYLFPELVEHPCTLTNMRGLFSDVIADHVFGYILCFSRNLHLYLRQQLKRHWEPIGGEEARSNFASGPGVVSAMDRAHLHMSDGTLGVVGLGARDKLRKGCTERRGLVSGEPRMGPRNSGIKSSVTSHRSSVIVLLMTDD